MNLEEWKESKHKWDLVVEVIKEHRGPYAPDADRIFQTYAKESCSYCDQFRGGEPRCIVCPLLRVGACATYYNQGPDTYFWRLSRAAAKKDALMWARRVRNAIVATKDEVVEDGNS